MTDLDRHWPSTAPFAYVRLHGDNDEHNYDYTEGELHRVAAVVHGWRMRGLEVRQGACGERRKGLQHA